MNTINFTQIAVNEKIPGYYGEISTVRGNQGVFDYPTRLLVIGQKLASGSAAALTRQIITDPKQAKALFGRGSQLALMCDIILQNQTTIEVHAIGVVDEAASATAAGSITVTAAATTAGTLFLYVAGQRLKIGVKPTQTVDDVATAIAAAINELTDLPVTAAIDGVDSEKVNITSRHKGLIGNEIKITTNYYQGEQTPAGLGLTFVQLSGGTANPDIQDALDVIEGEWFTDIIMPWTDASNLAVLEEELEVRYSATGKMDAHAYIATRGTFATNYTFCNGRNSPLVSNIPFSNDAIEPAWLWAAALGAMAAFWSNQHPARPYKNLELKGIHPPKTKYTATERRILLSNGGSTWGVNHDGEVVLERVVTMYQVNEGGIEDETWMDITTPKTFSHIRYDDNAYITTLYFGAEGKILTTSEAAAARSDILVTPKTIAASSRSRAELWITMGWVSEVIEIRAEVDMNDPTRVNRLMDLDITNPLMILATKLGMRI